MSESPGKLFFQTCFVFMPNSHKSTVQKYNKIDLNWNRVSSIEQTKVTKCWRIPLTSKCKQRKGLKWLVEKSNGFSWEKEGKEVAAQCTLGEFFEAAKGFCFLDSPLGGVQVTFFLLDALEQQHEAAYSCLLLLYFDSPLPNLEITVWKKFKTYEIGPRLSKYSCLQELAPLILWVK